MQTNTRQTSSPLRHLARASSCFARGLPLAGLLLATGCADLSMRTVDTQDRVIQRHRTTVPNNSVRVSADIDGTRLTIRTTRGCDLVTMEEIKRTAYREAHEDPTEEWAILGLMSAPITSGLVMLLDAQNVYESDRNSREFNPVGPTGAYVGGGLLLGLGAVIAAIPLIELIRIGGASDEITTEETRRGDTLQKNVPCRSDAKPIRSSVSLRAGGTRVNRNTDARGQLFVDLAVAVPPQRAQQYENVELYVANRLVEVFPMQLVRDEQRRRRRRRDEDAWSEAQVPACRAAAPADKNEACRWVQGYLSRFPNGLHAAEARKLLGRAAVQIATDPQAPVKKNKSPSPQDAVLKRAKEQAAKACAATCRDACRGKGDTASVRACSSSCVIEVCQ